MFERVYLGRNREEHAQINATIRRIFDAPRRRAATTSSEATDYLAGHDRPVRARVRAELD